MLTVRSGMERVLAQDSSNGDTETVVISTGSGKQEVVLLTQKYPDFQGALVVCEGGDEPQVRLLITQAVAALTGLGTARISVCKGG
jgi:stage III sporulation protein AG